jgi:hypothetical protein
VEENGAGPRGYLLFAWSPGGYRLRDRDGELPAVGAEIDDDGRTLEVVKVGPSPLPGDPRPCVFTAGGAS